MSEPSAEAPSASSEQDREWVREALGGDQGAYGRLMEKYERPLYFHLRKLVRGGEADTNAAMAAADELRKRPRKDDERHDASASDDDDPAATATAAHRTPPPAKTNPNLFVWKLILNVSLGASMTNYMKPDGAFIDREDEVRALY